MRSFTNLKIILLSLFAFLILFPNYSQSQSTGSIGGTITDAKDKSPLIGATVKLVGYNIGAVTDDNGNYIILNVDVGTYNIEASYIGYDGKQIKGIKISVDQRNKINFELSVSGEIKTEVIVIEAERKGIDVEQSGRIIDDQQIKNSGTRGVTNIVSKTAGVVQDERGQNINIRGGRSNENIIIVDGIETTNPLDGSSRAFVPNSLMQEISVLTGGFGAEYGNVLSGVINVSTKGGSDKYSGSVEVITDEFTGKYVDTKSQGYNLYNITLGGPIIPSKKLARVFGFNASFERRFQRIDVGSWVLDKLPTMVPDGKLKSDESGTFSYNGRLNINFKEIQNSKVPINLKFGATVNTESHRILRGTFILNNSDRNQIVENQDYQYFARISHEVSRNFFYELQGSYFNTKSKTADPFFGDSLGWYGDTNHVVGLSAHYNYSFAQGKVIGNDPNAGTLFTLYNSISDSYRKSDLSYIGFKIDATWALISKKLGDHEIKFGGEYKYNTLKNMSVSPVVLSDGTISDPIERWYSTGNGRLKSYGYEITDPLSGRVVADGLDAKHPIMGGFYIRDKASFSDFNFNGGVRIDFFDVNSKVLKSITTDLVGADGILCTDDDFVESKMKFFVSPRLGFSFPITDKTVFHAQYGKMIQMPQLNQLYVSQTTMQRFFATSLQDVIENSSLEPTKLTSYEIGLKHQVGDIVDLGLTVFYKESIDQIGAGRVRATTDGKVPIGFVAYFNNDFAISRGFDFYIHMRRIERLAFNFDYSLKYASGTGSDAFSKFSLANNTNEQMPVYVYALDYDQRHTGSLNLDYRFGNNDVPKGFFGEVLKNIGVNIDFTFHSGRPYSRKEVSQTSTGFSGDALLSSKNEVYTNWAYRFDLKIDKTISLWKSNWNFYVYVINLLNTEIVEEIFPGTGKPDDNGFLQTATGASKFANDAGFRKYWPDRIKFLTNWANGNNYGPPRQIRFGLNISF